MTRTALITGAGGFLARHVAAAFREGRDHQPSTINHQPEWRLVGVGRSDTDGVANLYDSFQINDLSDTARLVTLLEKFRPELAVHLAAPSSVPESLRQPLADLESHVLPTARLLEAIRLAGATTRFLLVSSAAVYGNPVTLPIAEDAALAPISPYGFHKLQQELLCDEYHRVFGVPVVKARVFSTFGEGLRRLAVFELTRRALAGDATVLGTGAEQRDYLYAGDVAAAIRAIAEQGVFDGRAYNVASGVPIAIGDLASRIFAGAGLSPQFTGSMPPGMPAAWAADVTRLQALGFTPRWTLDDALRRTIDWIRTHG
jgi:UDP-glucose 4-epimerase